MNQRHKILVVEGKPSWRKRICNHLSHKGYGVYECRNHSQILTLTRKIRPDLVLLDVEIPAIRILQVLALIYSERLSKVVLMTHHVNRDFMGYHKHNPLDVYICKSNLEASLDHVLQHLKSTEIDEQGGGVKNTKVIDEAKEWLMAYYQIPEEKAYAWMRKKSMDTSTDLSTLAKSILKDKS